MLNNPLLQKNYAKMFGSYPNLHYLRSRKHSRNIPKMLLGYKDNKKITNDKKKMVKIISVGKKKIHELLELPQFKGRTQSWAYNVLSGQSQTEQAEAFRNYVLANCHGTIITKKRF